MQRPWDRQELGLLEELEDDHIVGCGDQWAKWYEERLKRGQKEIAQGFLIWPAKSFSFCFF